VRKYFLVLIIIISSSGLSQKKTIDIVDKRSVIVRTAEEYLGYKYREKVNKTIFDCSGFVKFLMASIGENITRSTVSQIHDGKRVSDTTKAKPGDILLFKGRNARNNRPGHVGLVHHWGNDTLYFIHSSTSNGIEISNLFDTYFGKRFMQVRDIIGK
jgi:lipoprotein Spr